MITIGLLLPRSTYYTGISFDIFEGMKASLEAHQRDKYRIVTENIGFGTDKQQCYRGAEQLLMHHDAKIVFAYVSHRIAQILRPLFTAANRLRNGRLHPIYSIIPCITGLAAC
jgi:branched-chain amino acid transport system substrate-binding protein